MGQFGDPAELAAAMAEAVPGLDIRCGDAVPADAFRDWSTETGGTPSAWAAPRDTAGVAALLAFCNAHDVPVVPQGGLTGMAGGAVPSDGAVLLSLRNMTGIESLDPEAGIAHVLAGTPLQVVQEAAEAAGLCFGLDLGARGSCQIGGTIATNAGGNRVIRYGMMRDLVLGLEAVLADGTVLTMMNEMPKNNAAMDLKPLFIGSEGTLGVVTRAVLRLHPGIAGANAAFVALPDYPSAVSLLALARRATADRISAFELIWPDYLEAMLATGTARAPLTEKAPLYALVEMQGPDPDAEAEPFLAMLEEAMEAGLITDAAIARSQGDVEDFWAIRDNVAEILTDCSPTLNFDVSVPMVRIGEAAERMREALTAEFSDMRRFFFGHAGDSNLHLVTGPLPGDREVEHRIDAIVYGVTRDFGGSVSAEHGIGLHKRCWLHYSRSEAELDLLRRLKAMLDPRGILNPGKVL